ncbi:Two-component hybrid sensor and regulator [Minicystis rosea]|nr:Two-component hybrid sensor and regulator [Minicystis rosea]
MSAIVLVLLEAGDVEAARILAALSAASVECRVRRATTRAALRSALAEGRADAVVAGSNVPGCAPPATLEEARAHAPETPVVLIAEGPLDDAFDWLAAGAAACVPARRLDRLAHAIRGAIDEATRRREEAAAARRRDDFLACAAHQLRTPLNALLGWASLLRARRLDEPARARALETIERNARIQARMIDDLLDVSHLITGTLRVEPAAVEIGPAAASAVEAARPAAEAAGVALAAELDEGAGAIVGDARRIEQIVTELLGNAIRATPRGGRVDLCLARDGGVVRITVRDTGRGIRRDALPQLFDGPHAFDRPAHHGLGVGLWIARHLVEAHGGTIAAESPGEGHGATFTIELPAQPAPSTKTPSTGLHERHRD